MNLLLLPGNSQKSGIWLQEVEMTLAPYFKQTYRHSYKHWEEGTPEIDLDLEIKRISELISPDNPYMIFAKSAGTTLALKAIHEEVLKPKAVLLCGIPLLMVRDHNLPFKTWLQTTNIPVVAVQNENDPYGMYKDVAEYMAALNMTNLRVISHPGDTHDYLDFEFLLRTIEALR